MKNSTQHCLVLSQAVCFRVSSNVALFWQLLHVLYITGAVTPKVMWPEQWVRLLVLWSDFATASFLTLCSMHSCGWKSSHCSLMRLTCLNFLLQCEHMLKNCRNCKWNTWHAMRSRSVMSNFCDPMDCNPPGPPIHGASPGKNTGVGCHASLQGIFSTQESNSGLLQHRQILYHLSHQGSPEYCSW